MTFASVGGVGTPGSLEDESKSIWSKIKQKACRTQKITECLERPGLAAIALTQSLVVIRTHYTTMGFASPDQSQWLGLSRLLLEMVKSVKFG